jgi:hypothetical protein
VAEAQTGTVGRAKESGETGLPWLRRLGPARRWALGILIAAISLSPRIPLPIDVPGRRFDLRVEDVVLVGLLGAWIALRPRIDPIVRRIAFAFAAYLAVALVATVANVALAGLPPIRGATYWGKQVEYMAIFVVVASWARTPDDRRWLLRLFLALGILNAIWVGYQAIFGLRRSLFQVFPAFQTNQPSTLFESYGPGLIGEVSPLSTGAFFLAQFCFFFAIFVVGLGGARRSSIVRYLAVMATIIPLVFSQSRVSIGGSFIGASTIAIATRRVFRAGLGYFVALTLAVGLLTATGTPAIVRLLTVGAIRHSLFFRTSEIWAPVVGATPEPTPSGAARPSPSPGASPTTASAPPAVGPGGKPLSAVTRQFLVLVLGHGSGSMGSPTTDLPTESSNQYLRALTETGILGLLAFAWLLAAAFLVLLGGYRRARAPAERLILLGTLATLLAYTGAALLQDVFLPVIPNEVLWYLIGLASVAAAGAAGLKQNA